MKTYFIKPTMTAHNVTKTALAGKLAARPLPPRQPLPRAVIDPAKPMLKLGLDVHLQSITAVVQKDHANPHAPRVFTNDQLIAQVKQWIDEGFHVFCVQESCGFGFTLHRRLVEAGAQSFLITPVALNGARKTDKLDARALCLRLSRWLDGNRDELAPIRIPTEAEQRRRETTRRRQFLAREIRCLANRGHGQVAEYCHAKLPHRWWGPRLWKKLEALDPWVLALLTDLRVLILAIEQQLRALETEIKTRVQEQPRPKALGELTLGTLDGEVCDWHRFSNRKQIGSYTGCCPGEHSSGPPPAHRLHRSNGQRQGARDIGGSRLAVPAVATRLEKRSTHETQTRRRHLDEKESRHRAGPPTGHRPLALADRPGHHGRPRLGARINAER